MVETLAWATSLIANFGYLGLGLTLVVNCLGIPIASEVTLPLAGIAIHAGDFDAMLTLLTVVAAQMVGFIVAYLVARHTGVGLIEDYGHYLFISHRQVVKAQQMFQRHGPIILLIGLCMPGMHGYMGYSAGLAKMRAHLFLLVTLAGTTIWSLGLLGLGYLFGNQLAQILEFGHRAGLASGIVVASLVLYFWYSRLRRHKSSPRRQTSHRRAQVAAKTR
jgi:membrane protein DedA with SNARE-associated domain